MTTTNRLSDGQQFTHKGHTFVVNFEHDSDTGAPWDETDCHGPVSAWANRDKKPGEWVLSSDRFSKRFYDYAEAMRIAKRDGWGLGDDDKATLAKRIGKTPETLTPGEIRAEAVRKDFEYLKGWANDDWHYVGVCVRHVSDYVNGQYGLWGMQSDDDEGLTEAAYQLADERASVLQRDIENARFALKTGREAFRALAKDLRSGHILPDSICTAVREKLALIIESRKASHAQIAAMSA